LQNDVFTVSSWTRKTEAAAFETPPASHLQSSSPMPDAEYSHWFAEHVQPHEPMLRAWLRSRFPDEPDVDDIVQETYYRLLQARAAGGVSAVKAFLFATARNLTIDRLRHRKVARSESLADYVEQSVSDETAGIPEIVARNQELEMLTEAIQSLPDRCREIFTLRKVYGLSQMEIAKQLGLSENTVTAQITIGAKKCMVFLQQMRREREGRCL
jgi:RNA polymerase sigma factor (sigma-70 family)